MLQKSLPMAVVLLLATTMPAFAQAIDLSAVNSLFQSILDALTGTTGRLLMSIVVIGVLLAGTLNFMDWSRVLQVVVVTVLIGVVPTVIQSIWGATP